MHGQLSRNLVVFEVRRKEERTFAAEVHPDRGAFISRPLENLKALYRFLIGVVTLIRSPFNRIPGIRCLAGQAGGGFDRI